MKFGTNSNKLLIIGLLLAFGFGLNACRKYEDGPTFSLRSKIERATNNWTAQSISRNSIDETLFFSAYTLDLASNGSFVWRYDLVDDSLGVQEVSGIWEIVSAKEQIRLTYGNPDPDTDQELLFLDIRRLAEDELWVEYLFEEDYYSVKLQ